MWPFGKKKKKTDSLEEDAEYILDPNEVWEEVTGEHEIERESGNGNGKIKIKGEKARKLKAADEALEEVCDDIDRQIKRLREIRRQKRTTGSLRALNPAKKGEPS